MIVTRLLFSLLVWAITSIVVIEGVIRSDTVDYLFLIVTFVLFTVYAISERLAFLEKSLAKDLSNKPFIIWFMITCCVAIFLVILGIFSAYVLDEFFLFSYQVAARTGTLVSIVCASGVLFYPHEGLIRAMNQPATSAQKIGPRSEDCFRDVLAADIVQLKLQTVFLLILCGVIGVYAGYQATQAIGIIDSGGVSTESANRIKERISAREQLIFEALKNTNFSDEGERIQYEKTKEQIDAMLKSDRDEYKAELESIKSQSQDVTGRFVFTFFSSFFVRVGSVLISLGFFSIVFYQYRRIDRQRAELCQLRLAHLSIEDGHDPSVLEKARKALAIRDYVPTRRETDSIGAFASATIGGVPDLLKQSGLNLNSTTNENVSAAVKEQPEPKL